MKIIVLIASVFLFIILMSVSYAECRPDTAEITEEQQRCGAACESVSDLIKRSDCINDCNGEWMRAMDDYYACLEQEREQKLLEEEEAEQRRLEEQRLLEEQEAEQKRLEEQELEEEQTATPDATFSELSWSINLNKGEVELTRSSVVFQLNSDFKVFPGDAVRTGENGVVELISEGSAIQFGESTYVGFIDTEYTPGNVISQPEIPWDQDPNYKYASDTKEYLETLLQDLVEFHEENRPDYLKTCMTAASGITAAKCLAEVVVYVYEGITWFDKKIKKDYSGSSMVLTPTAAITTDGTQFIVEVAQDGATTVTTLEGTVFVTDLASRKTVIVEMNHKITVPKTSAGLGEQELQQGLAVIDPESINQWWVERAGTPNTGSGTLKRENMQFFLILVVISAIAIIIGTSIRRRYIKPKV